MKKFLLCTAALLCVLFMFGVSADMAMPEYVSEQIVISNPEGAALFILYDALQPSGEVIPYGTSFGIEYSTVDGEDLYFEQETGKYYFRITYQGHERYLCENDFTSADEWDAPFPFESEFSNKPVNQTTSLTEAYAVSGPRSNVSTLSIILIAVIALLAAAVVVLVILLITSGKKR